jgi:hypothetical protein
VFCGDFMIFLSSKNLQRHSYLTPNNIITCLQKLSAESAACIQPGVIVGAGLLRGCIPLPNGELSAVSAKYKNGSAWLQPRKKAH